MTNKMLKLLDVEIDALVKTLALVSNGLLREGLATNESRIQEKAKEIKKYKLGINVVAVVFCIFALVSSLEHYPEYPKVIVVIDMSIKLLFVFVAWKLSMVKIIDFLELIKFKREMIPMRVSAEKFRNKYSDVIEDVFTGKPKGEPDAS